MHLIVYNSLIEDVAQTCRHAVLTLIQLSLAVSRECIPQEPGRIEYYNQLFCLRGHLGGVSEIQTSLDVSDL